MEIRDYGEVLEGRNLRFQRGEKGDGRCERETACDGQPLGITSVTCLSVT